MNTPVIDVKIVDNVFVKMHHFVKVGDTHNGHSHTFDHITLLASGAVRMIHDKGEQEFKAPHLIVTPKDTKHQFIAIEPNTVFCCIHAIREANEVDAVAEQNISIEEAKQLLAKAPLTN